MARYPPAPGPADKVSIHKSSWAHGLKPVKTQASYLSMYEQAVGRTRGCRLVCRAGLRCLQDFLDSHKARRSLRPIHLDILRVHILALADLDGLLQHRSRRRQAHLRD